MAPAPRQLTTFERWLLAGILLLALIVRCNNLLLVPLWSDEAESTINALTIDESGLPRANYLGLPVFENVLVREWPGDPEYEFRDISYSDRGLAVYHGWLPLYAIAASLRLAGIEPDRAGTEPSPRNDQEIRRRTFVPRLPSVLFGMLALVALFAAARRIYSLDAAWAVLVLASFHDGSVFLTTAARYYAATLAAHAFCAWMMIAILQEGRRRYYLGLAAALVLLFHSHMLTFAVGCCAFGLLVPWAARRPKFLQNFAALCVLVAAGTVPWLAGTGFLSHSWIMLPGRKLLSMPGDLLIYPKSQLLFSALYVAGFLAVICAVIFRRSRNRLQSAFGRHTLVFGWLYCWMSIAYGAFFLLMPAASFFYARISVPVLVPALLVASVVLTACLALVFPRGWKFTTIPAAALLLLLSNSLRQPILPAGGPHFEAIRELVPYLQRSNHSGTRFYASPNDHLVLTYYSGVPVQSVAPIRKSFFDSYPGRIVYLEKIGFAGDPQPWGENPIFRGFTFREQSDWWKVFFYRFVDPVARGGKCLNYRDRKEGEPILDVTGWKIHIFPALTPDPEAAGLPDAGPRAQ